MTDYENLLHKISVHALDSEPRAVSHALNHVDFFDDHEQDIHDRAAKLVTKLRAEGSGSGVEAFLHEYGLDTREGIAVMCLSEALLRIPDAETADQLIEDTFTESKWDSHLGNESLFVNASTWGLLLTGKVINVDMHYSRKPSAVLRNLVKSAGEPVVRNALRTAMKLIGDQFVLGETIEEALRRARPTEKRGYTTSYDILGEGARTKYQAQEYYDAYIHAIEKISGTGADTSMKNAPSISVKLSALHPRYELVNEERVMEELVPIVKDIILRAKEKNVTVTIDAEEANRLDIELKVFAKIITEPEFKNYNGIGFVLQAYQKRALYVIDFLRQLARDTGNKIPVRLVKG
ncbi:MAG: trifunctional transcriptional regulator/proline dehydrogenase/L-glutamate gamma-semialdehyde dehydrogenase, partial [Rickettsiales bacterium]|nr:trifunctional transcriptional regulator/proline dehydrogenase/L-glutamate gamma-semialdehyde dehydrogenase [Rickettsiales bacterium]